MQTDIQVTTQTTFVRAVLVTGSDSRGNEFSYVKSSDFWIDLYNEVERTPKYIQNTVFPNVVYVRYGEYKMGRAEWVGMGCPIDLSCEHVDLLIDVEVHPVNAAQVMEREIDRKIAETCPHEHYWSAMFQMLECADCGKKFKPRTIPEERAAMQYNGRGSRNWTQTKGNSVTPLR
jgi:hypothetical protein